ncbi:MULTISPECIES: hypothetical protein [unclassified Sutcliffiella]|uniref:hypothetical protein n=1 Tax=unclassified Sutcliffiella TaxID=2837532 RepID=UPI0030CB5633
MFNKNKIHTVGSIPDFMKRNEICEAELVTMQKGKTAGLSFGMSLLPLSLAPLAQATPTFADSTEVVSVNSSVVANAMYDNMLHAFDPLITLVQALAYPIAMVVVLGGALFIMIGNREKGFSMMSSAGLGYVLVTLTPMILNILVEAMKSAV